MNTPYGPWKILWNIGKREVKRWMAQPIYLFCMLAIPAISVFFFLSLMHQGLPCDLPIAAVDLNNNATSRNLCRQLDAFPQTKIIMYTASFEEARIEMQKGKIYGIFYIPRNFSADATAGRQPKISFYTNGTYLIASSLLFRDMKTISVLASKSVGLQTGLAKGETQEHIMGKLQPIEIETHALGNPWLNYSVYLSNTILPGILELVILMVTVFSIGSEIKANSARKWLNLTSSIENNNLRSSYPQANEKKESQIEKKQNILLALIGKLWPQTLVLILMGISMEAVLYGWYQFPLLSGWGPMILSMICFVLACQSLGVFMISILPTLRLGLSFACLFGMIGFSISGFTYPVSAMDPLLQSFCNFFPLRHYFLIYVDQALNGRAFLYSIAEYGFLLLFLLLPLFTLPHLKKVLNTFRYIP